MMTITTEEVRGKLNQAEDVEVPESLAKSYTLDLKVSAPKYLYIFFNKQHHEHVQELPV